MTAEVNYFQAQAMAQYGVDFNRKPIRDPRDVLSDLDIYKVAHAPFIAAEMTWDFADSLVNIADYTRRRLPERDDKALKKLCRSVKELRKQFVRVTPNRDTEQHEMLDNEQIDFQDHIATFFTTLGYDIEFELTKAHGDIERDTLTLLRTTYLAIVCAKATMKYVSWADDYITKASGYRSTLSIMPNEMRKLANLLPQFAGNMAIDKDNPKITQWVTTLYNKIKQIEFNLPDKK